MDDSVSLDQLGISERGEKKKGSDKLREMMDEDDDGSENSDEGYSSKKISAAIAELINLQEVLVFAVLTILSLVWVKDDKILGIVGEGRLTAGRFGVTMLIYGAAKVISGSGILSRI